MKNKNVIYIIVVVVLVVVIAIAYALLKAVPQPTSDLGQYNTAPTSTAPFSNANEEGYSVYANAKYGFTIQYPTSLAKLDPDNAGDLDDLDTTDIFVGNVSNDTFSGTNLNEVHIIAGAKKTDEASCSALIYGNKYSDFNSKPAEKTTINGIVFTKENVSDAGAGNVYNTTRYSTYNAGICYELLALAHSTNLGILQETNPTVKQYDPNLYLPEFEEIVSTFHFVAS